MERRAKAVLYQSNNSKSVVFQQRHTLTMAIVCGIGIANLYYLQPLLAEIQHEFTISVAHIGVVITLGQFGYTVGLLLIVPLGDVSNQRALIGVMLWIAALALVTMALAQTVILLAVASFIVGLTSIIPPLMLPFAAKLAPAERRGSIVGTIMSGVLIGMLLARVLSGFVGTYWGWRAMYWTAAVITFGLAVTVRFLLPSDPPYQGDLTYFRLLSSLSMIIRSEPILQELMVFGFLAFGAFSAFWATLSFFLATPPYHYGSDIAGVFGLAGLVGALLASRIGKFADRKGARRTNGVALAIALCSFLMIWYLGQGFTFLTVGVVLFDLGIQANNIACQIRMSHLNAAKRSRLNAAYSIFYYLGGSLGSFVGTLAWNIAQWNGVCGVACVMLAGALSFYLFHGKHIQSRI